MSDITGILLQKHPEKYNNMKLKPYLRKHIRSPIEDSTALDLMSKKEPIKLMSYILNLPTKDRSQNMINILIKLTQDFTFFRNLVDEHFAEAHRGCCSNMSYAFFQAGSYVFMQGDEGNKFYVIIEGTVGIHLRIHIPRDYHTHEISENSKSHNVGQDEVNNHEEVMTLSVGDSFGERALMSGQPRAASIYCKTDCHFGVVTLIDYQKILKKVIERNFQDTINLLQEQPVFKGYSRGAMQLQSYYWKLNKIVKKTVLYRQGDEPKEVFIIKSGEFELTREERTPIDERRYSTPSKNSIRIKKFLTTHAKLAVLGPRELIGEEEVLSNSPRLCTCTCVSDSAIVLIIQKDNFERIVFKNEDRLNILTQRCSVKSKFRRSILSSLVGVEEKKQLQKSIIVSSQTSPYEIEAYKFSPYKTTTSFAVPPELTPPLPDREIVKNSSESPEIRKIDRASFLIALDKLCIRTTSSSSVPKNPSIPSTKRRTKSIYLPKPPKPNQPRPEKIVNFHTHALRRRADGPYSTRDTPRVVSSLTSLHNSPSLYDSQSPHPDTDMHYLTHRRKVSGVSVVNINSFPVFQALWNTTAEIGKESKNNSTVRTRCESRNTMRYIV